MQHSMVSIVKFMSGFFMLVFAVPISVFAQFDTIHPLNEIQVTAQRIDLTDIGKHSEHLDSVALVLHQNENLASLLSAQTPLFVRSNGVGTLATLGIRGGGASHTQILWNGIPLRNPMIGLLDLSLIPVAFIDEATIHYGGHGAAFGSGAVGGLISVSNEKIKSDDAIELMTSIGSWGTRAGQLQLDYGFKNIRMSSRFFAQNAQNDFCYRLSKDLPEKNQVHHELSNRGFLQEIYFPLTQHQSLTARLWLQNADRQIPPTSTQTYSGAAQQDKYLRTSLQWNRQGQKAQWQIKSAWLDEIIDYQDTLILLYTHNQFKTWLVEGETSFRLSEKIQLTGGAYYEIAKGESANYFEELSRNQTAFFSSIRLVSGNINWRIQAREELTEKLWSPLLFDLSAEWSILKQMIFKTSFSRNYRAPTLNDLHWAPGGNPELIPENGWTYETGLHYHINKSAIKWISSLTYYRRIINDWIMWMPPVKGISDFWSPINVAQVKSDGIETRSRLSWNKEDLTVDFNLGLDLTWSTFATPLVEFNIEAGEQLFYVPVENLLTGLNVNFGQWMLTYDHHWFGDANGINDPIKAFNIGNGSLGYIFSGNKYNCTLFLKADNLWDVPYRIIERRPMPGRGYSASVKFSFS
ncbi:MAG TPA: TonB-dependent receptor [Saprospiraceae bacterium]|nr:TonB-dependent receptor [Saprospiraceae bacterium]